MRYRDGKWKMIGLVASCNSLKIHKRLTKEHFNLGYASRMRNHFAKDVLVKKMLNLLPVHTINVTTSNSTRLSLNLFKDNIHLT